MTTDPSAARDLMERFAASSGLTSGGPERRYLWTDAFAVCNWLGLGEVDRARDLVGRVHRVLGQHREDDPRQGWISGLSEEEGAARPTAGGLRIGKPLPERRSDQRYHPELEWERDGQYFHYLTRWLRALQRMAAVTGGSTYHTWSVELARVAFDRFSHGIGPVPNRLHWKMSIDLTRPLVPSMGQHDPLDGYVAMSEVVAGSQAAGGDPNDASDLENRMGVLAGMSDGSEWTTEDPLGTGSLLSDAWFLARLGEDDPERLRLLDRVLKAATLSLREVRDARLLELPSSRRLAFRELGLAIGLGAADRLASLDMAGLLGEEAVRQVEELRDSTGLQSAITEFWLEPAHRRTPPWIEHEDINTVMLATAVHPAGYLGTATVSG